MKPKLIVVLGPTASGKSALAVAIAKKWDGEIISADSRQVYKRMDVGTGKVTAREMGGVPHHLLSFVSPTRIFTVAQYQKKVRDVIKKILREKKVPILCGGTGLYIQSVVDGLVIPEVPPNPALRKKLEGRSAVALYKTLCSLDPIRSKNIDRKNSRRLIRAIEVAKALGAVPPLRFNPFDGVVLFIGMKKTRQELKYLIRARLLKRFKLGIIAEVRNLHVSGISWKRLEDFGLEYRDIAHYLRGGITKRELVAKLEYHINQYAKRQMTWFKRDGRIHWVKNKSEAMRLISTFLNT